MYEEDNYSEMLNINITHTTDTGIEFTIETTISYFQEAGMPPEISISINNNIELSEQDIDFLITDDIIEDIREDIFKNGLSSYQDGDTVASI